MSDQHRGFYRKHKIERTDGSSAPGGKHEHCAYFVLDLQHDPFSIPALMAYAEACEATHPQLAHDIRYIAAGGVEDSPFCATVRAILKMDAPPSDSEET